MLKEKDLKIYHSISEVAAMFDVNETLLRYWEREFPQISPKKGGRGIRHYSKDDIEQIRTIYNLVKVRGMKLSAARETISKNRQGATQSSELIQRLQAVRQELLGLKRELDDL